MFRRSLVGLVALALVAGCSNTASDPGTSLAAWSKLYRAAAVRSAGDGALAKDRFSILKRGDRVARMSRPPVRRPCPEFVCPDKGHSD
jgi:hypothetical protein